MKTAIALKLIHPHDEEGEELSFYGPLALNIDVVPRVGETLTLRIRRKDEAESVRRLIEVLGIEHHIRTDVRVVGLIGVVRDWDDADAPHDPRFDQWLPPEEQTEVPQSEEAEEDRKLERARELEESAKAVTRSVQASMSLRDDLIFKLAGYCRIAMPDTYWSRTEKEIVDVIGAETWARRPREDEES